MADKETIDLMKQASELRNAAKAKLEEITKEILKQGDISEAQARIEAKKRDVYKNIVSELKEINSQVQEQKSAQKELVDNYIQQESKLKGLTGIQASLVGHERKRIGIMSNAKNLNEDKRKAFESIASLQNDLLNTSSEDIVARAEINRQLDDHYTSLDGSRGIHAHILKNLKEQRAIAEGVSNLSESQQDYLDKQIKAYDSIKTSIGGVLDTASLLLSNSRGAIGALVTGMGFVVDKIGKANSELGTTFFQTDGISRRAGVLSFFFDDAVASAQELTKQFGDTGKATFTAQAQVGLMAQNLGISGTEAASLVGSFARMNGGSTDIAADMVATSKEFAKQNGIIPSALMSDLAGSAEEFALFGEEGGKNILEAAGYAQKLGVSMSTISGITESLLDFESSVSKELELSAMLGRNINLSKARELAFNNDIEGATKETLKQLGGIEEFERMNYYQRKASADMLGVSVAELQRMVANQENAATMGGVINEKFSMMGEIINGGLNKYLGTGLKGLGGMITASGQLGMGFKSLGLDMGGMVKSTAQVLKNLLGMAASGVGKLFGGAGGKISGAIGGTKIGQSVKERAGKFKDKLFAGVGDKVAPPKGGGGADALTGKKSIMGGMSKINMSAVLKGAAAMLIVAAAVFVFGKAVQEFMKVSWSAVGMAVVSMLALVGAVALLGAIMMSGVGAVAILAGAAAMLVIASSVLVLGFALQAIGTGFEMMGAGLTSLVPTLLILGTTILSMVSLIPTIALLGLSLYGLSLSIAGLAASLMFLGTFGLPGLLVLTGIAAVSEPIMKIAGLFGLGESSETGAAEAGSMSEYESGMMTKMDSMITELKSIKEAYLSNKDVYMDSVKVTNQVSRTSERSSQNVFGLGAA